MYCTSCEMFSSITFRNLSLSLLFTRPPSLPLSLSPSLPPTLPSSTLHRYVHSLPPFLPPSLPPSLPPTLPFSLPPSLPPSFHTTQVCALPPSLSPSLPPFTLHRYVHVHSCTHNTHTTHDIPGFLGGEGGGEGGHFAPRKWFCPPEMGYDQFQKSKSHNAGQSQYKACPLNFRKSPLKIFSRKIPA